MSDILDELWKSRHEKDVLFLSIIDGYTIKESKEYPDSIFYMNEKYVLIEYFQTTKHAYISENLIWSVFETNFSLNYHETKYLMKNLLEIHLNLKGTIPVIWNGNDSSW